MSATIDIIHRECVGISYIYIYGTTHKLHVCTCLVAQLAMVIGSMLDMYKRVSAATSTSSFITSSLPLPPPPSTSETSQPMSLPADVGSSSSDYGSGGNGDQRLTTGGKRGGRGRERSTWGGRETKHSHRKPKRVTDLSPRTEITYPDSLMSYNIHEEGSVRKIGRGRDVSHCS